ncbi:DUF2306 domain-containing protein [Polaribacter glomeratus]|uniref:DUF2306 domain-containing protein n=1 Tax=Polaribacter glomeratus TaxID=102 RepID=A0A2S7WYW6_9FLAO|nr:DUF2306 domain-containing protein [Polaribacter glomeratus]PQJ82745.1 hypothetical protein BTO16_09220 [Polaribacter glomeratus]TXD65290.1 DUF2306 domain-containing protein [Polaribacter glomeratus]
MDYKYLMYAHLATVVPCFFMGAYLLSVKKGTPFHKLLGKIYMSLMMITAIITLFMPADVGPQFFNHFGYIHLFSFLTLYSVPTAIIAVKKGQVKKHKLKMILLYVGAIIIAGGFTFTPGRYLHSVFFGN